MFRDDDETRRLNLHGTGRDGFATKAPAKGYGWTAPTLPFMNALQEETANAIELADRELVKASNKQLRSVLATAIAGNWTQHATGAADFVPHGLAYDPTVTEDRPFGLWIACGADGKIATSLDGRTFTVVVLDVSETEQYYGIAFAEGIGWLMVGEYNSGTPTGSLAACSADGEAWSRATADDGTGDALRACTWDADAERWIAVGDAGHMIWTDEEQPGTADWHGMPEFAEARPSTEDLLCIASDGAGTVVAMFDSGGTFSRDGGRHWTALTGGLALSSSVWKAVVWDGARFAAFGPSGSRGLVSTQPGSSGTFASSWSGNTPDAEHGTRTFISAAVWRDDVGLPVITVAVCESGDVFMCDHASTTSPGFWHRVHRALNAGVAAPLAAVCWGRGGFVALTASGALSSASLKAY